MSDVNCVQDTFSVLDAYGRLSRIAKETSLTCGFAAAVLLYFDIFLLQLHSSRFRGTSL